MWRFLKFASSAWDGTAPHDRLSCACTASPQAEKAVNDALMNHAKLGGLEKQAEAKVIAGEAEVAMARGPRAAQLAHATLKTAQEVLDAAKTKVASAEK